MAKAKPISFDIRDPVYGFDYRVFCGGSIDQFKADVRKWYKKKDPPFQDLDSEDFQQCFGSVFITNTMHFAIWFPDRKPSPEFIAHESVHLSMHLLGAVNVKLEKDNHEALAYHVGFLVREISKKVG